MPVTTVLQRLTVYEMIFVFLFVSFTINVIYYSWRSAIECTGDSPASGVLCAMSIAPLITGLLGVTLMINWNSPHFWGMAAVFAGVFAYTAYKLVDYITTHPSEATAAVGVLTRRMGGGL